MKKLLQQKNKATWLLLTGILVLCAGFIVTGCGIGTGPQLKVQDPDKGQYALDYTDCPGIDCSTGFSRQGVMDTEDRIDDKTLTFEAWIKPKATSTGTVLYRGSNSRGARLTIAGDTATTVKPSFTILRSVISASSPLGTSTATYMTEGTAFTINAWIHIAGILTNQDHSAAAGHPVCAGVGANVDATDDPWHLDIYQDGTITACAVTYGKNTAAGDLDPTSAAAAYADEPESLTAGPGIISGIIDEARIWTIERSTTQMDTCRNTELSQSPGTCSWIDNMIMYVKFNEGEGHALADFTGRFSGGLEYPDGSGGFLEWHGWTTDTPF